MGAEYFGWFVRGRRRAIESALALAIAVTTFTAPAGASAQSIWLDEPLTQWNQAGMPIPTMPPSETEPGIDPRCEGTLRPAELLADNAIEANGWRLFGPYQGGWGITLVAGLSGHDGMCRPWAYNGFVFVNGKFAGTLSPEPSFSRSDGAWSTVQTRIEGKDRISATFVRYAPEDPLCCPSRPLVAVSYKIVHLPDGPVLAVDQISELRREQ